jgi:predicted small metal-binding protein
MNIEKADHSNSVVMIGALARKLQNAAAGDDRKEVYKIATDIMLEAHHIRILLGDRENIFDKIKKYLP